jgi:hypothetical protein
MLRCTLFAAVAIAALATVSRAAPAEDEATVRIVSPADGTVGTFGEPITVEIELSRTLEGSPFSLRVDGKGVWIGQQSHRKSFDSADWGAGDHWLQAAVFRDDEEIKSPVVWITVETVKKAPLPAPPLPATEQPRSPSETAAGPLVSDGFDDGWLDEERYRVVDNDPGVVVVEADNELRVHGTRTTDGVSSEGVVTVPFPAQSLQATVWFRTPVRFGARANSAYLRLGSDGRFAQITFKPSVGYRARCRSPKFDLETPPLQPHGDEWEVWHALTIAYNSEKRLIRGYVDERLLLGCDLELDEIVIGFGALTTRSGSRIDIRFDDLAVQPLTSVFNMGVPVAPPEEEPRWDRDPWLGPDDPLVPGEIVERRTPYGDYFEYVPHNVVEPALVAIVSHGSYGDDKMTRELSRVSARRSIHQRGWLLLADTTGLIVVAPSFDYWRFYGYRFLKGSPIGADEFIFRIVDSYRDHFDAVDDRIILVGHSAGAQFAQRFLLAYPHRIFAAVLSSAGTYTFPDETVDWPYGRRNSPNPDGLGRRDAPVCLR